jgi:Zn-dependent protease
MTDPEQLILLPLWYAVFLLSLTCHEAAHAWVAHRGGDSTAYHGGQVSLNPLPHVRREPLGTVLIPLVTYFAAGWMMGWASAPYDPHWEHRFPRRAAAMAVAGPAANLLLATLSFLALKAGLDGGLWMPALEGFGVDRLVQPQPGFSALFDGVGRLLSLLLFLNVVLGLFNLLPLPPLDGAAVLAGLVPAAARLRDRLRDTGMGAIVGLLVAIYLFRFILQPVFRQVLAALYGDA